MSSLAEVWIKKSDLEIMLKAVNVRNQTGISLQIGINDETNSYGQNVSLSVSQSKEDKEAKKDKYYVGNGKVFWTDGKIKVADKIVKSIIDTEMSFVDDGNLPF